MAEPAGRARALVGPSVEMFARQVNDTFTPFWGLTLDSCDEMHLPPQTQRDLHGPRHDFNSTRLGSSRCSVRNYSAVRGCSAWWRYQ